MFTFHEYSPEDIEHGPALSMYLFPLFYQWFCTCVLNGDLISKIAISCRSTETQKPKTQQQFNTAENRLASWRTSIIQRNCPIKLKSTVKCTQKERQASISSSVVMKDERECLIQMDNKSLMIILLVLFFYFLVILVKLLRSQIYGKFMRGLILNRSAKTCTVERQILSSNQ